MKKSVLSKLTILAAIMSILLISCSAPVNDNTEWESAILDGVTVKFPKKPTEKFQNNTTAGGVSDVKMLFVEVGDRAYVLSESNYPDEDFAKYTSEELNQIMDNAANEFMRKLGQNSVLIVKDKVSENGVDFFDSHIQSTFNGNPITVYQRQFIHNNKLYRATATTAKTMDTEEIWKIAFPFFETISFEGDK